MFTALEELVFVDYLSLISEWGFPIESLGQGTWQKAIETQMGGWCQHLKTTLQGVIGHQPS